jgi:hypothetical protein
LPGTPAGRAYKTSVMGTDWSRAEVEATVADYFDMLEREIRGVEYNKSEHRRRLTALLRHRSDGAIERKHQNISAVLIELGFVYIPGYKPLRNYQQLLLDVVSDRLEADRTLGDLVCSQMAEPATVPSVEDILSAMVAPPAPDPGAQRYPPGGVREGPPAGIGVNYLAIEARNRSLGSAGEVFVVQFEIARLVHAGKERLAGKVERVSETRSDALGFDVLSFETSGKERFIEVKTTAYGASTPFFVTRNEVAASRRASDRYHLYRTFDFRRRPRLFAKQGALEMSFCLEASQFLATIR